MMQFMISRFWRSRVLAISLSIVLATLAGAAIAKDKVVRGWLVLDDDDGEGNCAISNEFQDGTTIMVLWYPRTEVTGLALFNDNWDSLRNRDREKLTLSLSFRGNVEYTEWTDSQASIMALDNGREGILSRFGKQDELDFAVAFGYSSGVKIEADGRVIGSYNLNGSKQAILELRDCGARIMKKGGDPFAS